MTEHAPPLAHQTVPCASSAVPPDRHFRNLFLWIISEAFLLPNALGDAPGVLEGGFM